MRYRIIEIEPDVFIVQRTSFWPFWFTMQEWYGVGRFSHQGDRKFSSIAKASAYIQTLKRRDREEKERRLSKIERTRGYPKIIRDE